MPMADAEAMAGIRNQTASRRAKRLQDREKYRQISLTPFSDRGARTHKPLRRPTPPDPPRSVPDAAREETGISGQRRPDIS